MITEAERTRLKKLFSNTISLLCRSGLAGLCATRVDALIGVTLDNQEVVLVNFSENFEFENEYQTRTEIGETNSSTQYSHNPQKSNTLGAFSHNVKDECSAGSSQELCNSSMLVAGSDNGSHILVPDSYNTNSIECSIRQDVKSSNEFSETDSLQPVCEQTSVLESDSDCLLVKTELPENVSVVNNVSAENQNFIVSSADGIAMPSVYSSSSVQMRHMQNIQTRTARCNPYGSKFNRARQRYNTVEHGALYSSHVSCTVSK